MGLATLAPRRGNVRVVLHLDLEEDVDNGVERFNLGVWNDLFGSKFARRLLPDMPPHMQLLNTLFAACSRWRKFGLRSLNSKGTK